MKKHLANVTATFGINTDSWSTCKDSDNQLSSNDLGDIPETQSCGRDHGNVHLCSNKELVNIQLLHSRFSEVGRFHINDPISLDL